MQRVVVPELLDSLPAEDGRAVGSRRDLRRLNAIMGHASLLSRAWRSSGRAGAARHRRIRVVELGAGDGTLMLDLARRWSVLGVKAEATLVDRQSLLSDRTRRKFEELGWRVESVSADVFEFLKPPGPIADVMLANLFLHHFDERELRRLLELVAARTQLFLACEPRRSPLGLAAARLLGLIGCNAVTRHDAVVSVRAGFAGKDLSSLWPAAGGWMLNEHGAGLFSHCFMAKRDE